MFNIVLYQPEIPPNTGNLIRLCANSGFNLHLIEPLGFRLDDKLLRRAGLDYREYTEITLHESFEQYLGDHPVARVYACSTKGQTCYATPEYQADDTLLFGPETRGLPASILTALPPERVIRIPMQPHSRSLNLSNAVAIIAFEAWRQRGFAY